MTQYEPPTLARIFLGSQIVAPGVGVSNSDSSFSWLERFPEKASDGCEEDAIEPESLDKQSGYVKRDIQELIKKWMQKGLDVTKHNNIASSTYICRCTSTKFMQHGKKEGLCP